MSSQGRKHDIFGGSGGAVGTAGAGGGGSFYTGSNNQIQFGSAGILQDQSQNTIQFQKAQGTYGSGNNIYLSNPNLPQQQQQQTFNQQQFQQQQQLMQQQQQQFQYLNQQQIQPQVSFQQQQNNYQLQQQFQYPQQQNDQILNNQYVQQPLNYRDPNYIPDKIDFNFYEISTQQEKIKLISSLKFSNGLMLFQYPKIVNSQFKNEQLIVVNNLSALENLIFNQIYRIETDKGQWFCKVSDIDRIIMILSSNEFKVSLGYDLIMEVEKLFEDENIMKKQSGVFQLIYIKIKEEIANDIEKKLDEIVPIYSNKIEEPNKMKFELIKKEFHQIEQIKHDQFHTKIYKVEILSVKQQEKQPGLTSLSDICSQLKNCSCKNMGLCFYILLVVFVGFLIYWFIIRSVLDNSDVSSTNTSTNSLHHHFLKHLTTNQLHTF